MPIVDAAQASELICPFHAYTKCAGPGCMAWQWHGPSYEIGYTNAETTAFPPSLPDTRDDTTHQWVRLGPRYKDPATGNSTQAWKRNIQQKQGFCGRVQQIEYPADELITF